MLELKFSGDSLVDIKRQVSTFCDTMDDKPVPVPVPVDPVPVAVVPVPVDPVAIVPDTGGMLDVEGIPWDARIHTKAKTKLVKGTWKLIRNVDTTLVAQVKAELMGNAVPVVDPVPVAVVPPVAIVPPVDTLTSETVVLKLTDLINLQKLDVAGMAAMLIKYGVANAGELQNHPVETLTAIYTELCSIV